MSMWRVVDILMAVLGIILVAIRVLGVFFFGATNSPVLAIPAITMIIVILLLLNNWRNSVLLGGAVAAYLLSYVLGGFERMVLYQKLMPDLLEFSILCYFLARLFLLEKNRKNNGNF